MGNQLIQELKDKAVPFKMIQKYSSKPGIYALFFYGDKFPFSGYTPKSNEIIYIGKTESSQLSRDLNTHFKSGKTGSSTLRRSFGALLLEELKLKPIPRNNKDFAAGRLTQFRFDDQSEDILTSWMQDNLGLSFYEFPKSPPEIDALETKLISLVTPILNIDKKNPDNIYASAIRSARKFAATEAFKNEVKLASKISKSAVNKLKVNTEKLDFSKEINSVNIHKYEDIWRRIMPSVINILKSKSNIQESLQLPGEAFKKVGNRKKYNFNLEFHNGLVSNNIAGSAVARDLARIILESQVVKQLLQGKNVKISMNNSFNMRLIVS